ncbi:hypothetical protein GCM10010377_08170 [Streptomyces viridiviolaceus]|uniref:Uncharacterized protein n=1 Tax=Streptomyces viridiviolaceus TaxID=68282 RepID=A0ABW2DV20_9ACTN|nr:hypothetical protein [Streptomyces viridiviolaceus]GHB20561.1 hypothetical protein GCM10010377_08170 [Streptomyces viridiviolaceus]
MSEITPWIGLAGIRFGESRATLRDRLGEYRSFRRTPDTSLIDHYMEAGLMLGFDESDRLDLIECTDWAEPSLAGVRLTGRPFGDVLTELADRHVPFELDESGCSLTGLGVSLYSPAPDEPDVDVEGVAIFSRSRDGEGESERAELDDASPRESDPSQTQTLF